MVIINIYKLKKPKTTNDSNSKIGYYNYSTKDYITNFIFKKLISIITCMSFIISYSNKR